MLYFSVKFKKIIKIILSLILYYFHFVTIFRFLIGYKGVRILAYHRIENIQNDFLNMSVPKEVFEEQIKHLYKYYNIISLKDLINFIQKRKKIKKNIIVITFDDGYRDNYINAYPVVKKYYIPITVFLAAKAIQQGQPLWYDIISDFFYNTKEKIIDLSDYGIGVIKLDTLNDKKLAIQSIINKAKEMKEVQKQSLMNYIHKNQLVDIHDFKKNENNQMMTWDHIREMKCHGVTFGAHTMNHPILTQIPLKDAKREILYSKMLIEKRIGDNVIFFAYPNGNVHDFNEDIIEIIKESGYHCACTMIPGIVNGGDNLYSLKRIGIDKEFFSRSKFISNAIFATEIAGIFDIIFFRFLRS